MLDHTCRSRCLKGYYAKDMECYHCPAHCGECNDDGLCTSKYSRGGLKEGVIFEGGLGLDMSKNNMYLLP